MFLLLFLFPTLALADGLPPDCELDAAPDGHELFVRTWVPMDPRSPEGDGLGPVFNDVSCVACHAQGGIGGAGGRDKNVRLTLDAAGATRVLHREGPAGPLGKRGFGGMLSTRTSRMFALERATPALFGAGAIDAIPDAVLLTAAAEGVPSPAITGRVGRDRHGRVARFGWKGTTAHLADFVEEACANELGLQTVAVDQPGQWGPGPDMDDPMLSALTGFVGSLPEPSRLHVPGADHGEDVFAQVGCADCHRPSLGDVHGLYSDLLLHDMGRDLADAASGYAGRVVATVAHDAGATAGEWRTPPLWGVRDSAPYLHDGRATTLDRAIALHGGEATASARAFAELSDVERQDLLSFLNSLVAPSADALARR